jgi:flagellar hook-associated protein 3 FlgL
MRIATKTLYDSMRTHLRDTSRAMQQATEESSSGKKIDSLSDDPVGLAKVMDLDSTLSHIEQMERNIDMGTMWLTSRESALTQVEEILTETRALCVQMASATQGADERYTAAVQVDGYLRQIVSLSNTEVNGCYIFAGTRTETSPFAFDDEDAPAVVDYSGNSRPFAVRIGKDTEVTVGCSGEDIFGASGSSVFDTLIGLKSCLQNNDVDGISESMDKLDTHLEGIRTSISETGARRVHMEIRSYILQDLNLTCTETKSQIEDADLAEASIKLASAELAYQAALSSASEIMSLTKTLVNYM